MISDVALFDIFSSMEGREEKKMAMRTPATISTSR